MPENHTDPSGNTAAFRAFAHTVEPETPAGASRTPLLVGAAAVVVVLVALLAWLALS
ncbi:hypothetical protein OG777_22575 [Micromonospora peucetia]|uniref:MYXO-CTERM domain-containing protein n=1 Tax=Micromonospora peucetia TaxID=47871 RepID=A0A1C6VE74_9ACTN|nr:hypothetical protein [Micromonospora peucetia]MCX4389695.1 hypothetical protein [Micromonospora peucetia]WSA30168.1 hypothetical protein OIE14_18335 [Micromonospora peucetia]SCL64646.1 hypothetical protein GA0070608_2988 [Micromonospora peucetia]